MPTPLSSSHRPALAEAQLITAMEREYGPLLGGAALYRALGLPSAAAFRQAASRDALPVHVFPIPHRRGRFALTREVASWLASLHAAVGPQGDSEEKVPAIAIGGAAMT